MSVPYKWASLPDVQVVSISVRLVRYIRKIVFLGAANCFVYLWKFQQIGFTFIKNDGEIGGFLKVLIFISLKLTITLVQSSLMLSNSFIAKRI